MRSLPIAISLVIAPFAASFAADGDIAAPILPGFDIGSRGDSTVSSSDLTPAATFSVAMEGAFLTPDGIKLQITPGDVLINNWGGSPNAPRRVRAVIGHVSVISPASGSGTVTAAPAPGLAGNAPSAVPEPGTFLVGLSLLGFCAGLRPRGFRRE